eukprot:2167795-Pyramimonas_sp.AAC.1
MCIRDSPEVDQGPGIGCTGAWSGGPFLAGVACCSGSCRASRHILRAPSALPRGARRGGLLCALSAAVLRGWALAPGSRGPVALLVRPRLATA